MKPAPFEYLRPQTIDEALAHLQRHRDEARLLAGGQSLVPILNFRLGRFSHLIDINRIRELEGIRLDGGSLRIGATTRCRTIENSAVVKAAAPLLAEATKSIAHLPIRTRGTIGGSLAHADPAAEYPAVMLALEATLVARSATGERRLAAADFFQGMFSTALRADELLTEVRIAARRDGQGFGFAEFSRRPGDFAIVGIAAALDFDDGIVRDARIAAFGVEGGAQRVPGAERALVGDAWGEQAIERAVDAAAKVPVHTDIHATSELRAHLAGVMMRRALAAAHASRTGSEA